MSNINQIFFNEYLKLDNLCKQLYCKLSKDEIKGITNYIDDMKKTPPQISNTIQNWNDTLHKLIHMRHIRNHLAHDPDAFNEPICNQDDVAFIISFHKSILLRTDPLAQVRAVAKKLPLKRNSSKTIITITLFPKLKEKRAKTPLPRQRGIYL